MTVAQFTFYLLPVSGPVSLLEVDVGSVPGMNGERIWISDCKARNDD